MTAADLWSSAARDARDTANLLTGSVEEAEVVSTVNKALDKARATAAALEALQRLVVGVPEPRRGE